MSEFQPRIEINGESVFHFSAELDSDPFDVTVPASCGAAVGATLVLRASEAEERRGVVVGRSEDGGKLHLHCLAVNN